MSSLKNSSFGKRLRASHDNGNENSPRRKRRRLDLNLDAQSSPSRSPSKRTRIIGRPTTDVTNTPTRRQKVRYSSGESGDRFVPARDRDSLRAAYSLGEEQNTPLFSMKSIPRFLPDPVRDQANDLYKSVLRSELSTTSPSPGRILAYSSPLRPKPDMSPDRLDNPTDLTYQISPMQRETRSIMSQPRPHIRNIAKAPYRCLDAPDLSDDFYTNLVDWSSTGILGVGLGKSIFLWRSENQTVAKLCTVSDSKDEYSSVAWQQTGSTLAVGTYEGQLRIYDAPTLSLIRTYKDAHDGKRIACLSWTGDTLSSGSRDHSVQHWDHRDPSNKPFKRSVGHKQEVCGIKWSSDGGPHRALLASGGNDNKVCVWDLRGSKRAQTLGAPEPTSMMRALGVASTQKLTGDLPLYKFHQHKAAVKGLAWDPHISGVLASGGGQRDRCIRFWNTSTGTMLNEVDTGSQVCNLVWSINSHELVSTHGYSTTALPNQICIWKYPTMSMVTSLTGHTQCVQYVALNPNGDSIVTGGGDQTLRFWSVFPGRTPAPKDEDSVLNYGKLIR
ncbi:substrate-specific activator of APC-dependent proteolysis [Paramarasmius palmivorus]|uniref:Substrate-specific activator of APC-dependent proteolysis n=1 Tax=Paramarasmius palmivorus TaxID=297713 RepID=A0AAW0BTK4_9AGAR